LAAVSVGISEGLVGLVILAHRLFTSTGVNVSAALS